MLNRIFLYKVITFLFILTILGCSTEKNAFINRTYHNVTSRYNAYFNGNESMKQGVKKIKETPDNYSLILPVFQHSSNEAASSVLPDMDKSIKKASKVIKMHSITVKPKRKSGEKTDKQKEFYARKEFCNWVDDAYQMMGKAHFYKHDFYLALQTFEFVIKEYNNMPIRFEGLVWLARTYTELGNYKKAQTLFDQIEGEKDFPKKLNGEFATTYADFYLKQKKYSAAVPRLNQSIDYSRKKKDKARYKYILAQIYQQNGDAANASNLYAEVIKLNPDYEMAFNAKINRATSFDAGAGNSKDIIKQLNKMLKDDKNIDFQDQIYYALGNISYKDNKEREAIGFYKLSTKKSVGNNDQAALSYLSLADIYFAKPEYDSAQAFYDSSFSFLDKNHPRYNELEILNRNLTQLVQYSNTVILEDSLQLLALLPEATLNKVIDGIIDDLIAEEKRLEEEDRMRRQNSMMFEQESRRNGNSTGAQGGKWYFYNPQAIGLGKQQFANKWGSRKLEDHWRRKNKAIVLDEVSDENDLYVDSTLAPRITDNKTREYYLQDVPVTDSMMEISHERIKNALYNLGVIYKDEFKDYPKSIENYQELNKRYPDNVYLLATYYDLYQLYKLQNDNAKAEYYKSLIVKDFPDSKYAMILTNPNYFKEIEENKMKVENLYVETYGAFRSENYITVIENCDQAEKLYASNELMPKFFYLRALSKGENGDLNSMKTELSDLIKKYPDSEVKSPAEDVLKVLTAGVSTEEPSDTLAATSDSNLVAEAEKLYKFDEKASQLYICIVENKITDVNRLKFNISNYNIDYYSMIDFNVSALLLNDVLQMIKVASFDDKTQGLNYYNSIILNNKVYNDLKETDYRHFIISLENLKSLIKDQDVSKYLKFFQKHYLDDTK